MAKFNGGIFSKLKGKLAGVVFQQYEGMQVGKEYQPNVKNPNTDKQIAVRAAFKLASQLMAIYEYIMLPAAAKVSTYARMVRGRVVATLRYAIGTDGGANPTIQLADVAAAVNTIQATTPVIAPTISGANIGEATISATVDDVVRYSIVAYDESNNILGTKEVQFTATASPESIQAPLTATTPHAYDIMAVALRSSNENGNAIYGNINSKYTLTVVRLVNSGDVEVSHIASATIAQA